MVLFNDNMCWKLTASLENVDVLFFKKRVNERKWKKILWNDVHNLEELSYSTTSLIPCD